MEGTPGYSTRYVQPDDYAVLARIERLRPDPYWSVADMKAAQKRDEVIGIVAVVGKKVVGHAWYEAEKGFLQLLTIAVAPAFRRTGVGRALVDRVKKRISADRSQIILHVRETNLTAQLFFKRMGFTADEVFRAWYEDTGEDAFRMVYEAQK